LVDDQLQGRLVVNCPVAVELDDHCPVVVELDDRYLEAAELDDHLVQCAAALVQLVQLTQRIRPAQQVQLALLAQWVQLDALQQASQQGRRW
jgi:hypothetical protein